jgi:N-acetylmuramoyl-L-alanine amidase
MIDKGMNRKLHIAAAVLVIGVCLVAVAVRGAGQTAFTVVIDAGHGGRDPGSIGAAVNEKSVNLAVALRLGRLIEEGMPEVKVVYTRRTDRFVEVIERANIANRAGADLFISIHANAVRRGSAVRGAETYTLGLAKTQENLEVAMLENSVIMLEDNYEQRYEGFDPNSSESYIIFEYLQNVYLEQSISLASEIQGALAAARRVNRGVRQAGFLVLKATSMPSVLVELGFLSNRDEEQYLRSEAGQNQLAKAIYTAFAKYRREVGRKQGYVDGAPAARTAAGTATPAATRSAPANGDAAAEKDGGAVIYKVQILASARRLPDNSPALKGYGAEWYEEDGMYKYTVGRTADFDSIRRVHRRAARDFSGAFIIRTRNGKRLGMNEK